MSAREMREFMAAQMQAILDAYEEAEPVVTINEFAADWVEVNARMFRQSYAIERA